MLDVHYLRIPHEVALMILTLHMESSLTDKALPTACKWQSLAYSPDLSVSKTFNSDMALQLKIGLPIALI